MQSVEEPADELDGITLLLQSEFPAACSVHFLQELVRTDLALEQSGIPDLLRQRSKASHKFGLLPVGL